MPAAFLVFLVSGKARRPCPSATRRLVSRISVPPPPLRDGCPFSRGAAQLARGSPIFTVGARLLHDVPLQVKNTGGLGINRSRDAERAEEKEALEKRGRGVVRREGGG